jgi:hypothetical protein
LNDRRLKTPSHWTHWVGIIALVAADLGEWTPQLYFQLTR